jgi:molybdate transport repressor ModE-like protein
MIRIEIRPVWRFSVNGAGRDFDFLLIALLEALHAEPKLTTAARRAGISYRHAWNLIEQWQAFFGAPLVAMERGRGTKLTPLGSKLLWAGQRARARLAPDLEGLASEFARALNESLDETGLHLAVHASHDFAVAALRTLAGPTGLGLDVQFRGSFDALSALRRGECDLAGFHFPEGRFGALMARRYAECLPPGEYGLIGFVTRMQGFIVRAGNPKGIGDVTDLGRDDVRMVNRQRGSGTRALLEFLLSAAAIDRSRLRGYEDEEVTHAAVAALIAGGQADVGFGVQAAAMQYGLDFIPRCRERYYLACRTADLDAPAFLQLVSTLQSPEFQALVASIPGYAAPEAGKILNASDVFQEAIHESTHPA